MFTLDDLIKATEGKVLSKGDNIFFSASIDTRNIGDRDLFFALKGNKRDGHEFINEALKKASGAVISKDLAFDSSGKTVVKVKDTLKALQDLAKHLRENFRGKVISILGSNGKTTTKELLAAFLAKKYAVLRTEGNLNNNIGVPLCLSKVENNTEIMVLELGTNRRGDIRELCQIVKPQYALITNIGYEHLEGFGSLEGVREEELEVLSFVKTVFVNGDDEFLMEGLRNWNGNIVTFGLKDKYDYYATDIEFNQEGVRFIFNTETSNFILNSHLVGLHNVYNITAACAVAVHFGISKCMIKEVLEAFYPPKMRGEIIKIDDIEIFFDAYNANPSSMKVAIEELARRKGNRKAIAVLGDMLELGDFSQKAHEYLGIWLKDMKIDGFVGVGNFIKNALRYVEGPVFEKAEEAGKFLKKELKGGEVLLIKGSRGMKMEDILKILDEGGR